MRNVMRRATRAVPVRWRFLVLALAVLVVAAVTTPQAMSQAPNINQLVRAIKAKTDRLPANPPSTADTGRIVTDAFRETSVGNIQFGWTRTVPAANGKEFLANFTAHCSFATPDNNTAPNRARISLRSATSTGASPFLVSIEAASTDGVVTLVTGPVAGFGAAYSLQCIPGGANTFAQGMAQAWYQIRP